LRHDWRIPLDGRVPRLSATFRRGLNALSVNPGSHAFRAVFATIAALAKTDELPGPADYEASFSPGRAYVRRVTSHNVWLFYRFDADHVFLLTARREPPVPIDD
jgi:hypothetical protein